MPRGSRLKPAEVEFIPVRAAGAGGQNVNKVASAVHLRFDIHASSLPAALKVRLLALDDRRISSEGIIVIKAQEHRTQQRNRAEALERLEALVAAASRVPRPRVPTRTPTASRRERLETKRRRAATKALRRQPPD